VPHILNGFYEDGGWSISISVVRQCAAAMVRASLDGAHSHAYVLAAFRALVDGWH
jgi:hypothetical protein